MTQPDSPRQGAPAERPSATGWSPYPGLRPFQSDDADYFFGRDAEADEIVARLRSKRFVAVIGGSGSGKSSLVLAGAIPRLRSNRIKEAGDFWVPVVATPGTNHEKGEGPIRRLARKFCGELLPSDDDAARLEVCVGLLREKGGLGKLVSRFGDRLKDADELDLTQLKVNVLFLLDQFEELFHPSNASSSIAADCRELVARVVDQYKTPHPQICLAITMRSEHLNDCTRYEELPDAINAGLYLVKRLGAQELREAIEQPLLRYLRKHAAEQRSARRQARLEGRRDIAPVESLPDQFPIDAGMIERLLADSRAVMQQQDHADHLPLLQHLLFWIWHEAGLRCAGRPLVDALTLRDLDAAVARAPGALASAAGDTTARTIALNSLEACLEYRCEAIFGLALDEQASWEAVFRSLAFKEPNSGTYTQQRVPMADLCERLGIVPPAPETLGRRLQPWLSPHGYLHWDLDSRTVKVAHETLIRRWQRLRRWIDEEDRQFHVYLRLLEDCERWRLATSATSALSGGETLRRYEDAGLPVILKDGTRVARINRLLRMDRDGKRLASMSRYAVEFLDLSIENRRQRDEERKRAEEQRRRDEERFAQAQRDNDVERAKNAELQARHDAANARNAELKEKSHRIRIRNGALFIALIGVSLVFIAAYLGYIAERTLASKERTLNRSYALAAESQGAFQPQFKDFDGPQSQLRYSLIGAHFFSVGRLLMVSGATLPFLSDVYADRLNTLQNTERFSEARNIDSLRTILQGGVWKVRGIPGVAGTGARTRWCAGGSGADAAAGGAYFVERDRDSQKRGLVLESDVTRPGVSGPETSVSIGTIGANGVCLIERRLLSIPAEEQARVGVASDASNLVIAFQGYTQFHSVVWDAPTGVHTRARATVSSDVLAEFRSGPLPSRSDRFWTDVSLGSLAVRLFHVEPSTIGLAEAGQPLTRLDSKAMVSAACARFAETHAIKLNEGKVWQLGGGDAHNGRRLFCLRVTPIEVTKAASRKSTIYVASLYASGVGAGSNEQDKDLPLIYQLPLGEGEPTEFLLDDGAGWLAFRGGNGPWRAVPWSLESFRGMAATVFRDAAEPVAEAPSKMATPSAPAASSTAPAAPPARRPFCGRPGDDPQFAVRFNLILSDMNCPSDAELKRSAPAPR